jgi:hypothetical protein
MIFTSQDACVYNYDELPLGSMSKRARAACSGRRVACHLAVAAVADCGLLL